jgi:hypothetical protein
MQRVLPPPPLEADASEEGDGEAKADADRVDTSSAVDGAGGTLEETWPPVSSTPQLLLEFNLPSSRVIPRQDFMEWVTWAGVRAETMSQPTTFLNSFNSSNL